MTEHKDDRIDELIGLINSMQDFEDKQVYSEASTILMSWGMFLILAGLMDGTIAYYIDESPHFMPWFVCISAAFITQQIISYQPLLFSNISLRPLRRLKARSSEIIISLGLMAVIVVFLYSNGLGHFIMPTIGFVFGSINLYHYQNNPDQPTAEPLGELIIVIVLYLNTVGILILGYINFSLFLLQGLIFGITVGSTVFLKGFSMRQSLLEHIENYG